MQGATIWHILITVFAPVSIHAPYAGSDRITSGMQTDADRFNPRPLCRERQSIIKSLSIFSLPAYGAWFDTNGVVVSSLDGVVAPCIGGVD